MDTHDQQYWVGDLVTYSETAETILGWTAGLYFGFWIGYILGTVV